ncbi:hypothetical protein [Clostridium sp. MCC353]|uniref:hypothetical protein n=1 Tax=Clostridium sp. MCC353 TaxID=2592646 RepID=UPI00207AC280|nr:hypothetical protein [Clostridium sp. MCC353]
MKTKARLVAESVRLKQWSQQIRECQNRPAGLTMDGWCRQQGITKANYYFRLRRVRQAILNYSAEENSNRKQISDFVELSVLSGCLSLAIPREQTMRKSQLHRPLSVETMVLRLMFSLKHHKSCCTFL